MTVLSYLALDADSIMACADESETRFGRSFDIQSKIHMIDKTSAGLVLFGYSGNHTFGDPVVEKFNLSKYRQGEDLLNIAERCYTDAILEAFETKYLKHRGITLKQFLSNDPKIGEELKKELDTKLKKEAVGFDADILCGYKNRLGKFSVGVITRPRDEDEPVAQRFITGRYGSVGSGRKAADHALSRYMEQVGDKRIDPPLGAYILLEATDSAMKRTPITGTKSQLIYVGPETQRVFEHEETGVLTRAMRLQTAEVLDKERVDKAFREIVENKTEVGKVIKGLTRGLTAQIVDALFRDISL